MEGAICFDIHRGTPNRRSAVPRTPLKANAEGGVLAKSWRFPRVSSKSLKGRCTRAKACLSVRCRYTRDGVLREMSGAQFSREWRVYRQNHRKEYLIVRSVETEGSSSSAEEEGPEQTENGVKTRPPFSVTPSGWLLPLSDFWLQVAIFILAAGFVDAGFSGDWSRIGVLSKETEGELRIASVGVVPLAATLIWSISQRNKK